MTKSSAGPERQQTDESLALERAKADAAVAAKAAAEHEAEGIIVRARDHADQLLERARDLADERLETSTTREETEQAIAKERETEDRLIGELRAKADETIRKEREASARVLARLIPLEREKTDQHLRTERARYDDAVTNRDDFLAMVTHDLRDLLNGILLSAGLIADGASKENHAEESVLQARRIQRSAGRMNRLMGDLVDVARIDAGKLGVIASVCDAAATVQDAVDTWTSYARKQGIELQSITRGRVTAEFDHERVLQVLGNLITNAVKFSKAGSIVCVGVERVEAQARFFVKDCGAGIAKEDLHAVFERFWQTGARDRRGLGLGLYISRCLVEANHGKIWVESELGAGSTFYFTIPAAE